MRGEPTLGFALLGALGFVLLGLLAPLGMTIGGVAVSLWMLPLIAVHLWPTDAHMGWSVAFLLGLGVVADHALGFRLGTVSLASLAWLVVARPDLRDSEEMSELSLFALFALGLLAVVVVAGGLARSLDTVRGLWPDALAALVVFPLALRLLRLLGRSDLAFGDAR